MVAAGFSLRVVFFMVWMSSKLDHYRKKIVNCSGRVCSATINVEYYYRDWEVAPAKLKSKINFNLKRSANI